MLPFFLEKLWDLRPRINLSIIDTPVMSNEVLKLRHEIYETDQNFLTYDSVNIIHKRNLMYGGSHGNYHCLCSYSARFHEDIYKLDTLDGSDYYICKHGKRIK